MKLIGALLGIAVAWTLYKFAPDVAALFFLPTNILPAVSGVALVLTAAWAVCLNRLSVFEKLDDLRAAQSAVAQRKSRDMRRFIIRSIVVNGLSLVACIVALTFTPKSATTLYLVCSASVMWLVGFFQAYRCWVAAEESRIAIAAAQSLEKSRKKYLETMRADDRKSPVDRKDDHLNGYRESYRG
ncbi:hypothetical protein AWB81_03973 [Caballeronia arationis]|uniref:hypothetical protein n=1 Tax=Caballeronia arationis TaxID=1777142 RepID=UPI00074C5FDD|nr:hypothetical protein [Caballeronia arationis]SAK80551.1 hypothetical protein AWB81_03973 [Caballeronia arationis]